jgi:hypothetical protein
VRLEKKTGKKKSNDVVWNSTCGDIEVNEKILRRNHWESCGLDLCPLSVAVTKNKEKTNSVAFSPQANYTD